MGRPTPPPNQTQTAHVCHPVAHAMQTLASFFWLNHAPAALPADHAARDTHWAEAAVFGRGPLAVGQDARQELVDRARLERGGAAHLAHGGGATRASIHEAATHVPRGYPSKEEAGSKGLRMRARARVDRG